MNRRMPNGMSGGVGGGGRKAPSYPIQLAVRVLAPLKGFSPLIASFLIDSSCAPPAAGMCRYPPDTN